jgi:hypothetical protein
MLASGDASFASISFIYASFQSQPSKTKPRADFSSAQMAKKTLQSTYLLKHRLPSKKKRPQKRKRLRRTRILKMTLRRPGIFSILQELHTTLCKETNLSSN